MLIGSRGEPVLGIEQPARPATAAGNDIGLKIQRDRLSLRRMPSEGRAHDRECLAPGLHNAFQYLYRALGEAKAFVIATGGSVLPELEYRVLTTADQVAAGQMMGLQLCGFLIC